MALIVRVNLTHNLQDPRDKGCADEKLFESIAVASLFNFMDRMADALGAPIEGFQEMMKQMKESEYRIIPPNAVGKKRPHLHRRPIRPDSSI